MKKIENLPLMVFMVLFNNLFDFTKNTYEIITNKIIMEITFESLMGISLLEFSIKVIMTILLYFTFKSYIKIKKDVENQHKAIQKQIDYNNALGIINTIRGRKMFLDGIKNMNIYDTPKESANDYQNRMYNDFLLQEFIEVRTLMLDRVPYNKDEINKILSKYYPKEFTDSPL